MTLESRFRELHSSGGMDLPFPGNGQTAERHRKLAGIARFDLPLARLAEAHTDAIAILAEAGRPPQPGLYGVWAADTAAFPLHLENSSQGGLVLAGAKMFCTGAGLVDRALITVEARLVDVNLRSAPESIMSDSTSWKTSAFSETRTATLTFSGTPVNREDIVGSDNWYLERPGFWHGACGPASCWAGGAMGLFDYAFAQTRDDPHTMAHLAAMHAGVWALWSYLDSAGNEIDHAPLDRQAAPVRALTVRHLIEQACVDILTRLGRAYGPRALAFNEAIAKRYQELDLYIRQSHAERDLETLGRLLHHPAP